MLSKCTKHIHLFLRCDFPNHYIVQINSSSDVSFLNYQVRTNHHWQFKVGTGLFAARLCNLSVRQTPHMLHFLSGFSKKCSTGLRTPSPLFVKVLSIMFMERIPGSHQLFVRVLLIMSVVGLSKSGAACCLSGLFQLLLLVWKVPRKMPFSY